MGDREAGEADTREAEYRDEARIDAAQDEASQEADEQLGCRYPYQRLAHFERAKPTYGLQELRDDERRGEDCQPQERDQH